MDSNAEMYKKKYLKYKMKYLSLQQRGGGFLSLLSPLSENDKRNIEEICTIDGKTYVTCVDKYTKAGTKNLDKTAVKKEQILEKPVIFGYKSGIIIFANGDEYYGNLFNGLPEGRGSIKYKGKKNYELECDWIEGKQVIKFKDGNYVGELKDGKKNGNGKMMYADGRVYDGAWKDDKKNGQGTMLYANRDYYDGNWEGDLQIGNGSMVYANGNYYNGKWRDNQRHGFGMMKYADDNVYEGNFLRDKRDTRLFSNTYETCYLKGKTTDLKSNKVSSNPWKEDKIQYNVNLVCHPSMFPKIP